MARVTVEDCIVYVPDRFDLVVLAAQRARDVGSGSPLLVERNNDKNPVVALREIAENKVSLEGLRLSMLRNFQRYIETTETSSDVREVLDEEEKNWVSKDLSSEPFLEETTLSDDFSEGDSDPNLYS